MTTRTTTALALAALLGGLALPAASASAGSFHGRHSGFHRWHGGSRHHFHRPRFGFGYTNPIFVGFSVCFPVKQKVFVPGFGFTHRVVRVCD